MHFLGSLKSNFTFYWTFLTYILTHYTVLNNQVGIVHEEWFTKGSCSTCISGHAHSFLLCSDNAAVAKTVPFWTGLTEEASLHFPATAGKIFVVKANIWLPLPVRLLRCNQAALLNPDCLHRACKQPAEIILVSLELNHFDVEEEDRSFCTLKLTTVDQTALLSFYLYEDVTNDMSQFYHSNTPWVNYESSCCQYVSERRRFWRKSVSSFWTAIKDALEEACYILDQLTARCPYRKNGWRFYSSDLMTL